MKMSDKINATIDLSHYSTAAAEQEVNDLFNCLKSEFQKYSKYKLIFDSINELIEENSENNINFELKNKIKDVILSVECKQLTSYDPTFNITNTTLSYQEADVLQQELSVKLSEKVSLLNNYPKSSQNHSNIFQPDSDTLSLIDYKQKLTNEQEEYIKNLITYQELLSEIAELKTKVLPKVTENKIRECSLKAKMNSIKTEIAQNKVRVDIFTETSKSLEAYKALIKSIKEQQDECRKEIEDLELLKEKYKQVSCKQYDDILKSYIQSKAHIEKKKLMFNCLKGLNDV